MIEDFLTLMEKLARGNITSSERESLRNQFLRMMMAGNGGGTKFQPAQVGTDVDKLDGQHGSYYQNATNINAGTLNTNYFSSYNDLVAESKIGTGALQVAYGNHSHGATASGNLVAFFDGALAAATDVGRFVTPYAGTIQSVYITVESKGTANSTIVDVHKNGTTIFTTQANRPTVAFNDVDGVASGTPDVTAVVAGDVITFDIDAIATGAEGLGIVVAMAYMNTETPVPETAIFTIEEDLTTTIGKLRVYNLTGVTKTITKVYLSVSNAPVGAAIIADVNKNGTTLFTTQTNRPQIAAAAYTGSTATIENNQWADGDYLTLDIDQVGSTSPGFNLTAHVVYL